MDDMDKESARLAFCWAEGHVDEKQKPNPPAMYVSATDLVGRKGKVAGMFADFEEPEDVVRFFSQELLEKGYRPNDFALCVTVSVGSRKGSLIIFSEKGGESKQAFRYISDDNEWVGEWKPTWSPQGQGIIDAFWGANESYQMN